MTTRTRTLAALTLAIAGMGTPAIAQRVAEPDPMMRDYIFAYLVLDHPETLSEDEMSAAMAGHFSNMTKMADAGDLLIAGPLAEPRIDETYRGIFVFDTASIDKGKQLFGSDPSVQAGVFKPEMYVLSCVEPLMQLTRLEKEAEQQRLEDPDIPDEWVGRSFVLAVAPQSAGFERTKAVLIDATIDRIDDDSDARRRLLWIDASTVDEAKSKLHADDLDQWSFYGWYGSPCVAQLDGC